MKSKGAQSPQGRARMSPRSVARSWKRSSAHSPRSLGCGMLGLLGIVSLSDKAAPEGAFGVAVVVCLKAYPDTKL